MAACFELGISHSHFLGGPDEWTPEDRAKVVAYSIEKSMRCTMCGTADWEWEEDGYAYEAVQQVCFGCQKKDLIRTDPEFESKPGVSIILLPKKVAQKLSEIAPRAPRRRKRRDTVGT